MHLQAVICRLSIWRPGHERLVVSRRHEPDYFALSGPETDALWALAADARHRIQATHHPQGFNIGVNIGEVAGQTIPDVHVHVIPRYQGDVVEPKGGVRWILPERARYWD